MNTTLHMEIFREIEANFSVEKWKVGQVAFWPLVRYHIGVENSEVLLRTPASVRTTKSIRNVFRNYREWLSCARHDYRKNQFPAHGADVLLYGSGVNWVQSDGLWFDRFLEPIACLAESLGHSCQYWSPLFQLRIPRGRRTWQMQPTLDFVGALSKLTWSLLKKDTVSEEYEDFLRFCHGRWSKLSFPSFYQVLKNIYYIQAHSTVYTFLLERIKPKACFIECYYGTERWSLVHACQMLRIPCVDIQHGYLGSNHWAYADWMRVPLRGYTLLPNEFWVWSESELNVLNRWCINTPHRAVLVGNSFLQGWENGSFPGSTRKNNLGLRSEEGTKESLHVLITLHGYETSEWLRRLKSSITSMPDGFFWLRTHPARPEQGEVLKSLFCEGQGYAVNIEEASIWPLPVVLENIDVHVTEFSSTVLDAYSFGIPSVLLSRTESVLYKHQIDCGMSVVLDDLNQLPVAVRQIATRRQTKENFSSSHLKEALSTLLGGKY